jgi:hypothetical protein
MYLLELYAFLLVESGLWGQPPVVLLGSVIIIAAAVDSRIVLRNNDGAFSDGSKLTPDKFI